MPKPLLETGEQAFLVAGLHIENAPGIQPGLLQGGGEKIRAGHAPQDLTRQTRGDPGHEQGRQRPVHGSVTPAGHFMQGSESQSALRQDRIQRTDTKRQDAAVRPAGLFQPLDPRTEIGEVGRRSAVHGDLLSEASMFLICSGSHFALESMRRRSYPRWDNGEAVADWKVVAGRAEAANSARIARAA